MKVKICGLSEPHSLTAAIEGGADFVGFVFEPASPRYVTPEIAAYLARYVPPAVRRVGLFVNPTFGLLQQITQQGFLDMIQLHGSEPPDFIRETKERVKLPVIKAVNIAAKSDLLKAPDYEAVADWMLFDAKTPMGASGGTGQTFDWSILQGYAHQKPWMLAGGLNAGNIEEALSTLSPDAVDVSSGVESARGIKDPDKICAFLKLAKNPPSR